MRIFWSLLLLCSLPLTTNFAQSGRIDMEKVPETFEEFLVQLAWRNTPANRVLEIKQEIAKTETKTARLQWTRSVGFNLGFNQNADENDPTMPGTDAILFPRVSVGASLNLNPILTTGYSVRIAKENEKIAEVEKYQGQVDVQEAVRLLYAKYELGKDILKVRVKTEEDARATFELIKELFKNSEVNFEDYNAAYTNYHQSVEAKLEAAAEIRATKIGIEKWIGIPFDEAARLFGIVDK